MTVEDKMPLYSMDTSTKSYTDPTADTQDDVGMNMYEEIIAKCGYGKFYWHLILTCSFLCVGEAIEMYCLSLLLPIIECDFQMTSFQKGLLTSLSFCGIVLGSLLFGIVGDLFGRKKIIIICTSCLALFGILSSLVQTYWLFVLMRFFNGFSLGGCLPVSEAYYAEFQPKVHRGRAHCLMLCFWSIGGCIVGGLAYAIIPLNIDYHSDNFSFPSWRIFLLLTNIFSLIGLLNLFFLPESPKYFLSRGDYEKAKEIFNLIYERNKPGEPRSELNTLFAVSLELNLKKSDKNSRVSSLRDVCKRLNSVFKDAQTIKATIVLLVIIFAQNYGFNGLSMWFSDLFYRFELFESSHPSKNAHICEIVHDYVQITDMFHCKKQIGLNFYLNSIIITLAQIPGNICATLSIEKMGRRLLTGLSLGLTGFSTCMVFTVTKSWQLLIVFAIFSGTACFGFLTTGVMRAESLPTELRSTGIALFLSVGKIGAAVSNLITGALIDLHCAVPFSLMAALLFVGSLLNILMPDKTNQPIH